MKPEKVSDELGDKPVCKQMKLLLSLDENAVVATAARMAGQTLQNYMRNSIVVAATNDAQKFSSVVREVKDRRSRPTQEGERT